MVAYSTIALLLLLASPLHCYNILFMMPFCTKSHRIVFDPIVLELTNRGHKVTVMTSFNTIPDSSNVRNVVFESASKIVANYSSHYFGESKPNGFEFLTRLMGWARDMAVAMYQEPEILDLFDHPRQADGRPRYDLLVVDTSLNEFSLPLAQRMEIPTVYINPLAIFASLAWTFNVPHPYAAIASIGFAHPREMTFLDRAWNSFENICLVFWRTYYFLPMIEDVVREVYPEAKSLVELERNVSFLLANSNCALSSATPTMPNFVEVGGLNLVEPKKLPEDLENFMNSATDGVIYFSFGTVVSGGSMPSSMINKFVQTFARLPQKVIWKFDQDIDNLPKNIRIIKWAPQQDILGHPKLRLFITHGGGMSTQEAAYHACPLVAFPLSVDQFGNVANAIKKGFAESMNWETFTADELLVTIQRVMNNKSYKDNAQKISALMKDHPQPPAETAAFWMEYVIRHRGAPHLKSGAYNLNFFQYFLLDIIGLVLVFLLVVIFSILWILKKCFGYFGISLCPSSLCQKLCGTSTGSSPSTKAKQNKKKAKQN